MTQDSRQIMIEIIVEYNDRRALFPIQTALNDLKAPTIDAEEYENVLDVHVHVTSWKSPPLYY